MKEITPGDPFCGDLRCVCDRVNIIQQGTPALNASACIFMSRKTIGAVAMATLYMGWVNTVATATSKYDKVSSA